MAKILIIYYSFIKRCTPLSAQDGCETQLTAHARANMRIGTRHF